MTGNELFMLLPLFLIAVCAWQQPAADANKPVRPTPREKAHELLDGVVETAAGAQPEVAAAALLYVGQTYDLFDSKKALEYLRQAFASTVAIPPDQALQRAALQSRIAAAAANLSLPEAIDMLKRIQLPTESEVNSIVSKLLSKQQFDQAIELINTVGATGAYPFKTARQIFEKLPADDNRRLSIFAYAMSAYALHPGPGFADFLARRWKELPRSMVQTALGSVIENILNDKSDEFLSVTYSSGKGSASLHSRQDDALFNLMHVVREIDPKRADDILDSRKELAAMLEKFPEGSIGMGDNLNRSGTSGSGRIDPAVQQQMALEGQSNTIAEQVSAALQKKELLKAIDLAKTIPVPERRVEVLTRIALAVGSTDLSTAKTVLSECIDSIKDVKKPEARAPSWNNIAEAAHRAGDDKLAGEAIGHSLADSAELYKADSDADSPNEALRDEWPSMNAYRRAVITATKLMGVDAESILAQMPDRDLALLARVEMAQTLLDRPHESWNTSVWRSKRK